ncbi:MAG: metal ABC transporter substrate-binding protein [Gammaproteobacteria bacterium]|nr:MAG: metal ABC transporter substrate-binding protein [Gammaproteobacteria bacterium]
MTLPFLRLSGVIPIVLLVCLAPLAWSESRPVVVASFSILGDMVEAVGGGRVEVHTLVGPAMDAHTYTPAPSDARRLSAADMVVVNGLGFEGWMDRLVAASGFAGPKVVVSLGVEPIMIEGETDPHAWQSLRNAEIYVENIASALAGMDPDSANFFALRASEYRARLQQLDRDIHHFVNALPPERRSVVTSHDAFRYFESSYGLRFLPVQGTQPDADISARELAGLIRQIRQEQVSAIFIENVSDPRLMETVARETGTRIGGELYSDALSPADGPAATFIDLMHYNLKTLRAALRPASE